MEDDEKELNQKYLKKLFKIAKEKESILCMKVSIKTIYENDMKIKIFVEDQKYSKKPYPFHDNKYNNIKINYFRPYEKGIKIFYYKGLLIKEYENHILIFNKYPMIDLHLLVLTKKFQPQTEHILIEDFKIFQKVIREFDFDVFLFYNRGIILFFELKVKNLVLVNPINIFK
jgi:ATP adenylyltransferase/5',5'''-P-1,P-4-tetraphosphate phosphorylase II